MTSDVITKIIEILEKRLFTEKKPGLYQLGNVAVDLATGKPEVGVFINNILTTEGHGNLKAEALKQELLNIWEMNGAKDCGEIEKETPLPAPKEPEPPVKRLADEVKKTEPKKPEVVKPKGDEKVKEEKAIVAKEPEVALSIDVIKEYICPEATEVEAYNFLQLCHYRGLNPFLKEAYLIKYGNSPASMVVGKDAFTRKAEESGKLDGYEAGIVILSNGNFEDRKGTILLDKETLVGGWAKVYRKDTTRPFEIRVSLAEYQKFKDGRPQKNWGTMPATMIRKVALVQALREAFTKELGGCYDAAELDPNAEVKPEEAKS